MSSIIVAFHQFRIILSSPCKIPIALSMPDCPGSTATNLVPVTHMSILLIRAGMILDPSMRFLSHIEVSIKKTLFTDPTRKPEALAAIRIYIFRLRLENRKNNSTNERFKKVSPNSTIILK